MGSFIDLTGRRFGGVVVLARDYSKGRGTSWRCLCDCGNECVKLGSNLTRRAERQDCGCSQKDRWSTVITTHGMSGTPLHRVWKGMRQRCTNPSSTAYPNYGGRGISYDPRWDEFMVFYSEMSEGYREGLSLERNDNNKNYSKENCSWQDRKTQGRNKRNNVVGLVGGEELTLSAAVEKYGVVRYVTAWARLRAGWEFAAAVTTPAR